MTLQCANSSHPPDPNRQTASCGGNPHGTDACPGDPSQAHACGYLRTRRMRTGQIVWRRVDHPPSLGERKWRIRNCGFALTNIVYQPPPTNLFCRPVLGDTRSLPPRPRADSQPLSAAQRDGTNRIARGSPAFQLNLATYHERHRPRRAPMIWVSPVGGMKFDRYEEGNDGAGR